MAVVTRTCLVPRLGQPAAFVEASAGLGSAVSKRLPLACLISRALIFSVLLLSPESGRCRVAQLSRESLAL